MFNSNSSEHFLHKNITKTWNPLAHQQQGYEDRNSGVHLYPIPNRIYLF